MRPLIIIAALLPVLVITLGITFTNEITTGELIAIAISVLIVGGAIVQFILKLTAPSRAYNMTVFDSSIDKLMTKKNSEVKEYKVQQDNLAEIHVKIVAKVGASVEHISFRLLKRALFHWVDEQPRRVSVENIWDKDWEVEHKINPYISLRGRPAYTQEHGTGVLHFGNRSQLKGDIMWYRVIIHANEDWSGYLEYCAPLGDGRYAKSRRRIILRLTPDS